MDCERQREKCDKLQVNHSSLKVDLSSFAFMIFLPLISIFVLIVKPQDDSISYLHFIIANSKSQAHCYNLHLSSCPMSRSYTH